MLRLHCLQPASALGQLTRMEDPISRNSMESRLDGPDASCLVIEKGKTIAARCSLWWRRAPSLPGERIGLIGHYAARDPVSARQVLRHACEQLFRRGCTLAVGPMDGSTWRHYRCIVERGTEPVFFLEPDNPDDWPGHFVTSGFTPLASYSSAINRDLSREDSRVALIAARMESQGIQIRSLNLENLEQELRQIYTVAMTSFRSNFLFTPIHEQEFIALYGPLRPYLRPELVLIAEQCGLPVGFLFAVPDIHQAQRSEGVDTFIVKTLAVLPARSNAGLGSLLLARCHETARKLGYTRAIHALMHDQNRSRNLSAPYTSTIRRYSLFAQRLRVPS